MSKTGRPLTLFFIAALALPAHGAAPETGPVVKGYGPVFPVEAGAFNLAGDRLYKVSKDVSRSGDSADERNRELESVARFLNMQARNGTATDRLQTAVVVHGAAAKDLLNDAAYRHRFGVDNPNTGLLSALAGAGVEIFLCGQTAAFREFATADLHPAVTVAVSAMTAHVRLQSEGYTLIPF